jgi:hypothetical protein
MNIKYLVATPTDDGIDKYITGFTGKICIYSPETEEENVEVGHIRGRYPKICTLCLF